MPGRSFLLSLGMHLIILSLMFFQIHLSTDDPKKVTPALMIVDLTQVKIADKTNLPAKVKPKKTPEKESPKAVPKPQPKPKAKPKDIPVKENKTPAVKKPDPKPVPAPKPIVPPAVKNAVPVKEEPAKKETKKPEKKPQKQEKVKKDQPSSSQNTMDSLLKSVRKIQKPLDPVTPFEPKEDLPPLSQGIEGGQDGMLSRLLTISEQDLIANQLRTCWNVNAGVVGVDDMIIEITATVGRDGRIKTVHIVNMKSDSAFQTMAESARRAVLVCDKRDNSPFKILAEKYGAQYDSWKELFLRFNPIDKSVF